MTGTENQNNNAKFECTWLCIAKHQEKKNICYTELQALTYSDNLKLILQKFQQMQAFKNSASKM